ncbi:DUF456 domain-containing protein [Halobacteriales archaeon QH_2_65_14]|nr:MAG: DUF456 domain-containing protein [Halobacteriales archaeon QH_2_65_14]
MSTTLITLAAFGLLVAGLVTSILPQVPGEAPLSLAGVYLYWWNTGYSEPSTSILLVLTLVGVVAMSGKLVGPVITAKIGGTPVLTTTIGSIVGAIMFVFWGTLGLVLGTLLTVLVLEYLRRGDIKESAIAAVVVVLVSFSTKAVKVLLTAGMLLVMVVVAFL